MKSVVNLLKHQSRYSLVSKTFCVALMLNILINPVFAQSTDPDRPTPLTSNEITGKIIFAPIENYYTFTALPGEVVVKLDVLPGKKDIGYVQTKISLLTKDAEEIAELTTAANSSSGSQREVKRVKFTRETPVIMRIHSYVPSGYETTEGTYRIRLEGNFK